MRWKIVLFIVCCMVVLHVVCPDNGFAQKILVKKERNSHKYDNDTVYYYKTNILMLKRQEVYLL